MYDITNIAKNKQKVHQVTKIATDGHGTDTLKGVSDPHKPPADADKISSVNSKVNPASSKNPENSSGGVKLSKPGDLQTEQDNKKQKSSTVAKSSTGLSQPFPDYRGLAGDEKLIASAAFQYVEHITNVAPSNNIVNRAIGEIKKFLEKIKDGQRLSVNNFINTADNSVFVRKVGDDSSYLTISDKSTVRLSNHAATAAIFNTTGEDANNISLVVRSKIQW